jgi:tetratricopeptide (TPR) repeat protein
MEEKIIEYLGKKSLIYVKIENEASLKIIYDSLIHNNLLDPEEFQDPIIYFYYGVYYNHVKNNKEMMKMHYLMAIDKGCDHAMHNIARYYQDNKDCSKAEKYYLMAIEKGNSNSMFSLSVYYEYKNDYDKMLKYLSMMIEKGFITEQLIQKLTSYYEKQKDLTQVKKYTIMGTNLNFASCIGKINTSLQDDFDLDLAIECYNHLNEHNLTRLNKLMSSFNKIKRESPMNLINVTAIIDCTNCLETMDCIFIKCGHPICYHCFGQKCRLCDTPIIENSSS